MRWLGIIVVASVVAGLLAAYVPVHTSQPGEAWIVNGTTRTSPTLGRAGASTVPLSNNVCAPTVTVTRTVTVTQTLYSCTKARITQVPECTVERVASYPEPPPGEVRRLERRNVTIYTDGVVEVRVPAVVGGRRIPITMTNTWDAPIRVDIAQMKITIINASTDGAHYFDVGWTYYVMVPTTTRPPLPASCEGEIPYYYEYVYEGAPALLWPGNKSTPLSITIPQGVEALEGVSEAWLYIKATLYYWPIREVYKVHVASDARYSYLEKGVILTLYKKRSLDMVFRVHVHLASG